MTLLVVVLTRILEMSDDKTKEKTNRVFNPWSPWKKRNYVKCLDKLLVINSFTFVLVGIVNERADESFYEVVRHGRLMGGKQFAGTRSYDAGTRRNSLSTSPVCQHSAELARRFEWRGKTRGQITGRLWTATFSSISNGHCSDEKAVKTRFFLFVLITSWRTVCVQQSADWIWVCSSDELDWSFPVDLMDLLWRNTSSAKCILFSSAKVVMALNFKASNSFVIVTPPTNSESFGSFKIGYPFLAVTPLLLLFVLYLNTADLFPRMESNIEKGYSLTLLVVASSAT